MKTWTVDRVEYDASTNLIIQNLRYKSKKYSDAKKYFESNGENLPLLLSNGNCIQISNKLADKEYSKVISFAEFDKVN